MLFTFAGSGHTKYMAYLLEMICDLEFESSPELRQVKLESLLVNPTGREGGFQAFDIFQEYLNRCLEPIVQRKDTDFGSDHIRNIWSRNVYDIYQLKTSMRAGVGLAKRGGRHPDPHTRPEVKTLLKHFKDTELHSRRPGRNIGKARDIDIMQAGIRKLRNGQLKKWIKKTVDSRGLQDFGDGTSARHDSPTDDGDTSDKEIEIEEDEEADDDLDGEDDSQMTFGVMHSHDGELVIETDDVVDCEHYTGSLEDIVDDVESED